MKIDRLSLRNLMQLSVFIIFLFWGLSNYPTVISAFKFLLGVMLPFILGCCMAFVLNLPLNFIEETLFKKMPPKLTKHKRGFSISLSLFFVTGIILLVVLLVLPELGNTFVLLASAISFYITEIGKFATELMIENPDIEVFLMSHQLDWDSIINNIAIMLQTMGGNLINSTLSITVSLVSGIVNAFLGLIFSIYILMHKTELTKQCKSAVYAFLEEKRADRAIYILSLTNRTFQKFVSGQCIESIIIGIMFFVAMLVFKMPYALMISVLVGFTALIPIFGAFIGCAIGIFLILMVNPMQAIWFLIMFLVIQQFEGNVIYPKVVGTSVGLPPMWVLLAVTVGGGTMGIIGMLLFIPLTSVFYSLVTSHIAIRIDQKKIDPKKIEN